MTRMGLWWLSGRNLLHLRRRFAALLVLFLLGYGVTAFAALLIMGVIEMERLWVYENFFGNPLRTYTVRLYHKEEMAAGRPIDVPAVLRALAARPEGEGVTFFARYGDGVRWAGTSRTRPPRWAPPIATGRYFTPEELAAGAPVALVGLEAAQMLGVTPAPGEQVRYAGREWTIVGVLSPDSPLTGRSGPALRSYIWLPLWAAEPLLAGQRADGIAYLYVGRRLTPAAKAELRAAVAAAGHGHTAELALAADDFLRRRSSEVWLMRLVGVVVGGAVVLFAAVNLAALLRYWVKRRQQELAVRLAVGATAAEVTAMLVTEQGWLLLLAYGAAAGIFHLALPAIRATGLQVAAGGGALAGAAVVVGLALLVTRVLVLVELRRQPVAILLRRGVL